MKRYITMLFIAVVSMTANIAVAQQDDIQLKDTVKLQVINEQVPNEDGQTSNKVILESKDERLVVKWVEEDTIYHIYTADTIVKLEPTTPQGTKLVVRGANQDKAGISCWSKPNANAVAILDSDKSHTLRDDKTAPRITILKLNPNTHPDGIELEFAQERGKRAKARLWRVKPWSKAMKSLPVKVYIKQKESNSPSSLIEDSIFSLVATDTLEYISIEWNTPKNCLSPTLKIDNRECELEREGNHSILKDHIDSLLQKEGVHVIQFECKMFVSDKDGFKLEPYRVEYRIERLASKDGSSWQKLLYFACSYWQVLSAIIIVFLTFIWRFRKRPNKPTSQGTSQNGGNSPEVKETDVPKENTGDPHAGNSSSNDSVGEVNKPTELKKKDELLKQLQTLIDITAKPEEPQKAGIISKILEKSILMHYAQEKIKQQKKLVEFSRQLSNLYKALEDGVVDKDEFNGLKKTNKVLKSNYEDARKAAESLYKEQLLFLLERLYANYICNSSNNERLKTLVALFDKEIDPSNPKELAGRFNQKLINVLLAEIELCFISVNKKAYWCNKYDITYSTRESLDNLVNDIYTKGLTAAEAEIEKQKKEKKELEKQVEDLGKKLHNAQEELKNRPVIPVSVLPEEFEKEKAKLIKTHKKEVETLNETITGLEATITELKNKHKEEISALETKHKEEVNKLKNTHKEQLAAIDAKHKREIDNLNEAHKKEVETLKETITGIEATIIELKNKHKEEISALETKHKEEVNKLKNAQKEQLAAIDVKHKREIDDLNEAHKKEVETLNETITGLDSTIIELKNKHKKEISDIETKHEKQLGALIAEHTQAIDEIKQSHAEKVKILVAKPNRWCNNFITEVRQILDDLGLELNNLQTSVDGGANSNRTIFVTAINEMVQFFGVFKANINKICDENCNQDDLDLPTIRESLLTMFNKVLSYSGSWANRLFLFESYSRVPQLAEQMRSRGLDVATLERAAATAKALFAKSGISVVEPAVLAAPFKSDSYDFENTDVLIYRFFPDVAPQDFRGRVFDLVRVGYNVVRGEHKNPVVVYF